MRVASVDEFEAAVRSAKPGDTITLADQEWPALTARELIGPVLIEGPATLREPLALEACRNVTVERVLGVGGTIDVDADCEYVAVREFEFTECWDVPIQLRKRGTSVPSGVLIEDGIFHDNHARPVAGDGNDVRVNRIRSERLSLPGCEQKHCPEHFRWLGGGPVTLTNSFFGEGVPGEPLIRFFPQDGHARIRDYTVAGNIIVSAERGQVGIDVEAGLREDYRPLNGLIANNVILTPGHAIGMGSGWEEIEFPGFPPPTVANNVLGLMSDRQCRRGRFVSNLAHRWAGPPCAGITVGQSHLDDQFRPTEASVLVLGMGDPTYAPLVDFYGVLRTGPPDLGAVWHIPDVVPPLLGPIVPRVAPTIQWTPADFPDDEVHILVEDIAGNQLTWFSTKNDGVAYTTFPWTFWGARRFRVASLDETVVSEPQPAVFTDWERAKPV